jgi:hypothetical protein
MKNLIKFLRENVNEQDVSSAIDKMYATRYPLYVVDGELNNIIQDLLDEYGEDKGWDENWWFEDYEIDDLLFKIAK